MSRPTAGHGDSHTSGDCFAIGNGAKRMATRAPIVWSHTGVRLQCQFVLKCAQRRRRVDKGPRHSCSVQSWCEDHRSDRPAVAGASAGVHFDQIGDEVRDWTTQLPVGSTAVQLDRLQCSSKSSGLRLVLTRLWVRSLARFQKSHSARYDHSIRAAAMACNRHWQKIDICCSHCISHTALNGKPSITAHRPVAETFVSHSHLLRGRCRQKGEVIVQNDL